LEGWLKEDLGALTTLEGVKRAAGEWQANGKRAPWLAHRSGRLEEAEKQAAREAFANFLTAQERVYLAACRAEENTEAHRRKRVSRIITYGSAIGAMILLGVAGVAGSKWIDAEKQKGLAEEQTKIAETKTVESNARLVKAAQAESQWRAEQSQSELKQMLPVEALLLALAGLPDDSQSEVERKARIQVSDIVRAYNFALGQWNERCVMAGHTDRVRFAAFGPGGRRVLTVSADGTARMWDAGTCEQIGEPIIEHSRLLSSAAFSPDGRRIVIASDQTARIWDAETGQQIGEPLKGHVDSVNSAAFSPDGRLIVTASNLT
jgi:hypothetical protein